MQQLIGEYRDKTDCFYREGPGRVMEIYIRSRRVMEISLDMDWPRIQKYVDKLVTNQASHSRSQVTSHPPSAILQLLNEEFLNMRIKEEHFYYIKCQVLE